MRKFWCLMLLFAVGGSVAVMTRDVEARMTTGAVIDLNNLYPTGDVTIGNDIAFHSAWAGVPLVAAGYESYVYWDILYENPSTFAWTYITSIQTAVQYVSTSGNSNDHLTVPYNVLFDQYKEETQLGAVLVAHLYYVSGYNYDNSPPTKIWDHVDSDPHYFLAVR